MNPPHTNEVCPKYCITDLYMLSLSASENFKPNTSQNLRRYMVLTTGIFFEDGVFETWLCVSDVLG
jgi:hypothetical protein